MKMSSQASPITKAENQAGKLIDTDEPPQAICIPDSRFYLLHIAQYKCLVCTEPIFI